VLLAHPGGPFWSRRDAGAWSIAKGEIEEGEDPLAAARREFEEETGASINGEFMALAPARQGSGKVIYAFAVQAELDPERLHSNTFALEWPPKSGQLRQFPEVDRAAWFGIDEARVKIIKGQAPLLDRLLERLQAA
jgi:predicted NUDIX family NTP pyrophosphohydrolase